MWLWDGSGTEIQTRLFFFFFFLKENLIIYNAQFSNELPFSKYLSQFLKIPSPELWHEFNNLKKKQTNGLLYVQRGKLVSRHNDDSVPTHFFSDEFDSYG